MLNQAHNFELLLDFLEFSLEVIVFPKYKVIDLRQFIAKIIYEYLVIVIQFIHEETAL